MRRKQQLTELECVLARTDVENLRRDLREAFKYHVWYQNGKDRNVSEEDQGAFLDSDRPRDELLAICVLAMSEYDDPSFLGLLSAGPLEDALGTHPWQEPMTDEFLARIVDEARRTPRFRWMLSGVWTYSAERHVAEAIKQAVGSVSLDSDRLPPRPSA